MADNQKLDFIIAKLDALKGLPERLDNVMGEINRFRQEVNEWKRGVESSIKQVEDSVKFAHGEIKDLKKECDKLKDKNVPSYAAFAELREDMHRANLKDRINSYKHNLIFEGLEGAEQNRWETESMLREFWVEKMEIPEGVAHEIILFDCHRLKPRKGRPANIVAKFAQMSDRDFVLSYAKNLKKQKVKTSYGEKQQFFVQQHYPIELQDEKRELMSYYRRAAKENLPRSFRVVGTQLALFINRQRFVPGMKFPSKSITGTSTLVPPAPSPSLAETLPPAASPSPAAQLAAAMNPSQNAESTEDSSETEGDMTPNPPPEKRNRVEEESPMSQESPSLLKHDLSASF